MEISNNAAEVFKTKEELIKYLQASDIESGGGMFAITMDQFMEIVFPEHDIPLADRLSGAAKTYTPLAVSRQEFELVAGEDSPVRRIHELVGLEFQTSVFIIKDRPYVHLVAVNTGCSDAYICDIFANCFLGCCEGLISASGVVIASGRRLKPGAIDALAAVNMSIIDRDVLGSEAIVKTLDFASEIAGGIAAGTLDEFRARLNGVTVGC